MAAVGNFVSAGLVSAMKGIQKMMTGRSLGRHRTFDIPRVRDTAHKTELARFKGAHIIAEREGSELVIYALNDEHGMPASTMTPYTATDRRSVIRTLADINKRSAELYRKRA
jgi:hypothetical protein